MSRTFGGRDFHDLTPRKAFVPGGHKPFDYTKLANLTDLRNALSQIREDCQDAMEAIDRADLQQSPEKHMAAAMILSGLEIKMTNFAAHMRAKFLN
jgi:hypothetical protein